MTRIHVAHLVTWPSGHVSAIACAPGAPPAYAAHGECRPLYLDPLPRRPGEPDYNAAAELICQRADGCALADLTEREVKALHKEARLIVNAALGIVE